MMYFNTEAKETGKGVLTPALKAFVAGLQNQRVLPADALPGLMSGRGHKSLHGCWVSPLPGPHFTGTLCFLLLVGRISVDDAM